MQLSIHLLGPFHVTLDGEAVTGFESNKVRALLTYLAVESDRPHSREALTGLLWPEQPEKAARHNLRQALSNLRRAIHDDQADPPFLGITRGTVGFNPSSDHRLDVTELSAHITESETHAHPSLETCASCIQRLEQAVALYRGDFLQGLFAAESLPFEEWAVLRRERFHLLALDTLRHVARYYERRRDYDRARRYARRQVELEPWREQAHQQLMRLLARSGQRGAALAQYETCRRVLSAELGVEPAEETQALYERIRAAGSAQPHNLPTQLTPFIGRQEELAQVEERLENPECRLLTLVGPGGIGKTRLALQAATGQMGSFINGVFFVPLAPLSSREHLVPAVAQALGFSFYGEAEHKTQLLNYLRGKEMLLVLDSFEHLLAGVEHLLEILQQAPDVKILVTSRELLNLRAEWLLEVNGLAFPRQADAKEARAFSAVQLFLESAHRVEAGFDLSAETTPAVVRVCQLLQGTPLGIELAAAAVRAHPPGQIAAQIERDLDFLSTSMRDVPARHQSLRAVFDHSWRLLSETEQAALKKLSVFRGSFPRQAAQAVAGVTTPTLAALVDKSFLSREQEGRYEIHQIVKQYAAEKLACAPREGQATRDLHCDYYAYFLYQREETLKGSQQLAALDEIGAEVEDVRVAWDWAVTRARLDAIALAAQGLYLFYWARNWFQEGQAALEQAVVPVRAGQGENSLLLARLWTCQTEFYARLGNYEQATTLLQQSRRICERLQAWQELADVFRGLGTINYWSGEYDQAIAHFRKSLTLSRQAEDEYLAALALTGLANAICDQTADYEQARPLYEQSLALSRQIGDQFGIARALINQGAMAHELGDYAGAKQLYQQSLDIYRALGYRPGLSAALNNLGQVASALGEYDLARELVQESLDIKRETGDRNAMIHSLLQLGAVTRKMGDYGESKKWHAQTLRLALEIQALHLVRYVLVGVAELENQRGERERALELLSFVLHQGVGEQELRDQAHNLRSKLEAALSPQAVAQCQQRGQARTLEAVVAGVLGEAA
jgi:predicted ATPase/DNA-binding SARP family transcriptional activator